MWAHTRKRTHSPLCQHYSKLPEVWRVLHNLYSLLALELWKHSSYLCISRWKFAYWRKCWQRLLQHTNYNISLYSFAYQFHKKMNTQKMVHQVLFIAMGNFRILTQQQQRRQQQQKDEVKKKKFRRIDGKMRTHCQRVSRVLLLKGLIYHRDWNRLEKRRFCSWTIAHNWHSCFCEKKVSEKNHYLSLWTLYCCSIKERHSKHWCNMAHEKRSQLLVPLDTTHTNKTLLQWKGKINVWTMNHFYRQRW